MMSNLYSDILIIQIPFSNVCVESIILLLNYHQNYQNNFFVHLTRLKQFGKKHFYMSIFAICKTSNKGFNVLTKVKGNQLHTCNK